MKKTIIKRILAMTIVFLMIISTPFYISENINNSPYANAAAATFTEVLGSELFKQILIPTLISAGLVFKSKESIKKVTDDTIEWLKQQGFDWKPPDEPEGPNLEDVIKEMLKAVTLVSASYELVKGVVKIPKMFWDLIKSYVDDNFDEGDNITDEIKYQQKGFINGYTYEIIDVSEEEAPHMTRAYITVNGGGFVEIIHTGFASTVINARIKRITIYNITPENNGKVKISYSFEITGYNTATHETQNAQIDDMTKIMVPGSTIHESNPYPEWNPNIVYGEQGIVDNEDYDWNNNYTDDKDIVIPIERDVYGDLITDENGYYIPSIDTEEWIDVQPEEIPNLDPSGTPIPEIPEMPEVENPDDDEQTGILIYIGNILQPIVGQLSKIVEGVKTIVSNTNRIVFNTPNPVFDPITGEQIDPETGEAIMPGSAGDGIIGNGIDTNIPTDFEWGSFRHFLDIFFIFIYFIVILILIILKFLQIVFVGIPNITANTDLFTQYPNILEGVDYVKNLQVGGLTITVHQAFEFVFLIFFYIFIIKQIRKMYNAHVYEESAENPRISQDMKMDYYENIKNKRWSDNK